MHFAARTSRALLIIFSAGYLLSAPAFAQTPESFFKITICNKTAKKTISTFFHPQSPQSQDWILTGWYGVEPNSCKEFGDFPRGYFYVYTEQDGRVWEGNARHLCVSPRQTWRKVYGTEHCLVGEANRGFSEIFVNIASTTLTYTPVQR